MATGIESKAEKLEQVKINNDSDFGNDLSYEKEFLEKIKEKIKEKIPEFEEKFNLYFEKQINGSVFLNFEIK